MKKLSMLSLATTAVSVCLLSLASAADTPPIGFEALTAFDKLPLLTYGLAGISGFQLFPRAPER